MSDDTRIYVAVLADYNNGEMHGAWIDCDGKSAEDIQDEVNVLLRTSKHPNVMVDCPDCDIQHPSDLDNLECDTCNGTTKVSSAEEWAIHDHEGFYGLVGESTSFADVAKAAELIAEHGEAYALYTGHCGVDLPDPDDFRDHYSGEWESVEKYAEDYIDNSGMLDSMPENLRNYFDCAAFARDMVLGGDIYKIEMSNGNVAIFSN
jgi:antirestriction protein